MSEFYSKNRERHTQWRLRKIHVKTRHNILVTCKGYRGFILRTEEGMKKGGFYQIVDEDFNSLVPTKTILPYFPVK